jgi:threonine/homoserine/homoserine lactone efflux protein
MGYLVALTLDRGRIAGLLATCGVAAGPVQSSDIYQLLRWTGVAYILFFLA